PEGAERAQVGGEWRRREVVGREGGDVAGGDGREQRGPALSVPLVPCSGVERRVDGARRLFGRAVRKDEHEAVVAPQVERGELGPVALPELRPLGQEVRNVGSQTSGERTQRRGIKGLVEGLVRQEQSRGRVGASSTEARGDRD